MNETDEKIINILGVYISSARKDENWKIIQGFFTDNCQHQIATPNPENLLAKNHDEELYHILNNVDLAIPDGTGLKIAGWLMGVNLERYTGADLTKELLQYAQECRLKATLLSWRHGLSAPKDISEAVKQKYPNIDFQVIAIDRINFLDEKLLEQINEFKPDILFTGLGCPWQDKIIYHDLKNIPSAKIGLGIGGSFDFITGATRRAPAFFRAVGLEWLWRSVNQPIDKRARWQRIFRAVIVFPWDFIRWRFIRPHLYRPNVAILCYKVIEGKAKILIFERAGEEGHWQPPQGGTDGEDLATAGARELREEINCDKFKVVATFANMHRYEFGERMGKFNIKARYTMGYRGQKQGLCIAEFLGEDSDIKINYWEYMNWRWVDPAQVLRIIHERRRASVEKFLEKFRQEVKDN